MNLLKARTLMSMCAAVYCYLCIIFTFICTLCENMDELRSIEPPILVPLSVIMRLYTPWGFVNYLQVDDDALISLAHLHLLKTQFRSTKRNSKLRKCAKNRYELFVHRFAQLLIHFKNTAFSCIWSERPLWCCDFASFPDLYGFLFSIVDTPLRWNTTPNCQNVDTVALARHGA